MKVLISGLPRSGTTYMYDIVWNYINPPEGDWYGDNNYFHFKDGKEVFAVNRWNFDQSDNLLYNTNQRLNFISTRSSVVCKSHLDDITRLQQMVGVDVMHHFDHKILVKRNDIFQHAISWCLGKVTHQWGDMNKNYDYNEDGYTIPPELFLGVVNYLKEIDYLEHKFDEVINYEDDLLGIQPSTVWSNLVLSNKVDTVPNNNFLSIKNKNKSDIILNYDQLWNVYHSI